MTRAGLGDSHPGLNAVQLWATIATDCKYGSSAINGNSELTAARHDVSDLSGARFDARAETKPNRKTQAKTNRKKQTTLSRKQRFENARKL